MTQPVIDTVGTVVNDPPAVTTTSVAPPPARPAVQQLSAGDIIAKIHSILVAEHELTVEQISKIEQFGSVQIGDQKWETGGAPGGNTGLVILAMYRGEANEQIADAMQGDVRVYAVPVGVVRPGERAYRRLTVNPVMQKLLIDRMTYDRFVEAVAYEDFSIAVETHIVDLEDDEEEEPS